jgi:DNA-binding SARP family transcriptional activator
LQSRVLGPLHVDAGDSDTPQVVSASRLRTVLAVLLWRANQPVPVDELADLAWDGAPSRSPLPCLNGQCRRDLRARLDKRQDRAR